MICVVGAQRNANQRKWPFILYRYFYFIKLKTRSKIISRIPEREIMNKKSAMVSQRCSIAGFFVRMEMNEKKQEKVSSKAITEVNSSIILDADLLVTCNEVITNKQSPKRLADVARICWDVLFAITKEVTGILTLSAVSNLH
jgi:hypothetical protein